MIRKIRIDNSADSAVQSEKWNPDVKSILEDCRDASNYRSVIHEMFLEAPDDTTRLRVVDCKYPHHRLEDGKLVLDRKGVQAAYARAKQQNLYQENEAVREHIDRHRQELGMIEAEKKHEQAVQDIDRAYKLLQEALLSPKPSAEPDENLFVSMMEKPQVSAPQTGTPIAPADNTQSAAAPVDNTQAAPQPAAPEQPTIELTQVNQGEDTSTNNPVEGPDDRDPDNLDGNQRKEMYQSFADVMIQANNQNVFGTIFDEDVFRSEYKIVPYEMRYFYRLQNPVSVEVDELAFIPFGKDLLDAQEKYGLGKKMFVFATKSDKPIFFNMLDKTIWLNDDKVGDSFDGFIETLTQNNGVLPEPDEQGQNMDANVVDTTQGEDMTPPAEAGTEPVPPAEGGNDQPIDLTQPGSVPAQGTPTVNTGLEPAAAPPAQPGAADNMQPVDLTNASVEFSQYSEGFRDIVSKAGSIVRKAKNITLDDLIRIDMDIMEGKNPFARPRTSNPVLEAIDIEPMTEQVTEAQFEELKQYFESKYGAPLIVLTPSEKDALNMGGLLQARASLMVELPTFTIRKYIQGKPAGISDVLLKLITDATKRGKQKCVIMSSDMKRRLMQRRSIDDMKAILSHEYGHVMTFSKFTPEQMAEYSFKVAQLASSTYFRTKGEAISDSNLNRCYYMLNLEAEANRAARLDPSALLKAILGKGNSETYKNTTAYQMAQYKIPSNVLRLLSPAGTLKSKRPEDLKQMMAFQIDFARKVYAGHVSQDDIDAICTGIESSYSGILKEEWEADDSVLAMLRESTDSDFIEGDITQLADDVTELLEQASHGKLQFCFRTVKDQNGKRYRVVYKLEPSKIEQTGIQLIDPKTGKAVYDIWDTSLDSRQDVSQRRRETEKTRRAVVKSGHVNFTSRQIPIAIITEIPDEEEKKAKKRKKITRLTAEGIFYTNIGGKIYHDTHIVYEVGKMEPRATYKTTMTYFRPESDPDRIEHLTDDENAAESMQKSIDKTGKAKVDQSSVTKMRGAKATRLAQNETLVVDEANEDKRLDQIKQFAKNIDFENLYQQIKDVQEIVRALRERGVVLDRYRDIIRGSINYRDYRSIGGIAEIKQRYTVIVKVVNAYNAKAGLDKQIRTKTAPGVKPIISKEQSANECVDDSNQYVVNEGIAFPNDALDHANKKKALERARRLLGSLLLE